MTTLLVGFDSAWTPTHSGGLAGVLRAEDGTLQELGPPGVANFEEAEVRIRKWRDEHKPSSTLVLLDQPTIVKNPFGGAADPVAPLADIAVFETYPVLTLIALDCVLPDARPTGRLPKYNPARKKSFSPSDWQHVCQWTSLQYQECGLVGLVRWLDEIQRSEQELMAAAFETPS